MNLLAIFLWAAIELSHKSQPRPLRRPIALTPIRDAELTRVLVAAHDDVFGVVPRATRLQLLRALVRLEGVPRNHNLGNVGAPKGAPFHKIGGSRFRSFETFDEAAHALLTLLHKRCAGALLYADAGDPMGFAVHLRRCGYHETDMSVYGRSLRILVRQHFD